MSSISVAHCPRVPNLVLSAKEQPFYLMIKYANFLIIIFMNINENIRTERNS